VDDARTVPAPLAGLRVLDLTRNLAGPFCTMILGDLGADVIKIEQPGTGDDTRTWTPPAWQGQSATFLSANRNKRSVVIDLDQPDGVALVRDLARQADVLVESFKPGSLDKRGLGYDALRADNDRLIYCSVSAFGNVGPQRNRPGYDPVLQAHTGVMHMTGEPDQPPVRLGIGAMDMGASLWLVIGVMAALSAREQHGRGARIETSLYEIAAWWLSYHMAGYLGSGVDPMRQGSRTPMIAPYETYPTRDGTIFVAGANDNLFRALVDALGIGELAREPRFATNTDRVAHRDELRALLAPRFLTATAAEWEAVLDHHSVPCSRVRTVADLVADEQMAALGLLASVPHPFIDDLRLVDVPMSRDKVRANQLRPPPMLGQHTGEVLAELGLTETAIADLRARGVVA
jgi:crotonobetainyl-CoA:carnitine CoA-transferase CaiB-like acyl-CoA transferase